MVERFPETDIINRVKRLGIPSDEVMVIGSSALEVIVGSETRRGADLDLLVSDAAFEHLASLPGMHEVESYPDGNRRLVGNGLDVGAGTGGWAGRSMEDLQRRSYDIDGVQSVSWADLRRYKQSRGMQKDLDDLKIMDSRLYSPRLLPDAVLRRNWDFVKSVMPERIRDAAELRIAANGLTTVEIVFGSKEVGPRRFSGSVESNVLATQHAWEHSAYGVKAGQENMRRVEEQRYQAWIAQGGNPKEYVPLFFEEDRIDQANIYSNHDIELGHGRFAQNPTAHDEKRSADHLIRQLEAFGITDPRRLKKNHLGVMATTFNEATRSQNVRPEKGFLHMQAQTVDTDLSIFYSHLAVSSAKDLTIENFTRNGAGYDSPLTRLVNELNAQRQLSEPLVSLESVEDGYRLIDQYPNYTVTVMNEDKPVQMTLLEATSREWRRCGAFFRMRQPVGKWVAGDPSLPQKNADNLEASAEAIEKGKSTLQDYREGVAYEASLQDPSAVGGLPGAKPRSRAAVTAKREAMSGNAAVQPSGMTLSQAEGSIKALHIAIQELVDRLPHETLEAARAAAHEAQELFADTLTGTGDPDMAYQPAHLTAVEELIQRGAALLEIATQGLRIYKNKRT